MRRPTLATCPARFRERIHRRLPRPRGDMPGGFRRASATGELAITGQWWDYPRTLAAKHRGGFAMTTDPMPKAKTAHLIVREIDDETLVYDMGRHAATCLNEFAAKVWRRCDGTTSVADIADTLGEDERTVWLALHRLNKSKLLVEEIALPPDMRTGKTRREIAGQLGLGAAVAAVSSIVMTTAAHASCRGFAASCTNSSQCCTGLRCFIYVAPVGLCQ